MASMVAKVCNSHLSSLSIREKKSRSKRKFRADTPKSDPKKALASALKDKSNYELSSEKFEISTGHGHSHCPCDMCGTYQDHSDAIKLGLGLSPTVIESLSEFGPSRAREELVEVDEFQDANWNDLTESQLEELVMSNLDAIFKSAIKKIAVHGYKEEVATKAVLRSGLCYGSKDIVSNIVDNALVNLRNGEDIDSSKEHWFQDLEQLKKYELSELICVLREARPFFSNGDALWCLLICDMNVSHACATDGDPLTHFSSSNSPQSLSKAESNGTDLSIPNLIEPKKSNIVNGPPLDKEGLTSSSDSSLTPLEKPFSPVEETVVLGKKMHSTNSKREYTIRQKSFHLEKSYRPNGPKGTFRTAKLSGYILDKRGKPISDLASLSLKSSSLRISKAVARGLELAHESGSLSFSNSTSVSSHSATITIESKTTIELAKTTHSSVDPISKAKPITPVSDTELSLSVPTKNDTRQMNLTKKDEMIMKLLPRVRELECQLQEWTEWANRRVMQAAKRLGKDKCELKTLRQEKEEVERLKKDKKTLQENTMKKLYEMENALGKASGQIDRANNAVRRLKAENDGLRQEMEEAKLRALESAAICQEASKREKKALMMCQSWEKEKGVFQEELVVERRKLFQLHQEVEQAKDLRTQLLARCNQEEKTKDELHSQANLIRKEREQLEASAKSKEDTIILKAESNLQKYKDNIINLENEIYQLRLKSDSSKIAALKRGIDGSYANKLTNSQITRALNELQDSYQSAYRTQDFSDIGGVNRERECVMCLSEEMSVVFLPCAHQVVCKKCNELHEKQGMMDCPSCRCPIVRRISVRYARP